MSGMHPMSSMHPMSGMPLAPGMPRGGSSGPQWVPMGPHGSPWLLGHSLPTYLNVPYMIYMVPSASIVHGACLFSCNFVGAINANNPPLLFLSIALVCKCSQASFMRHCLGTRKLLTLKIGTNIRCKQGNRQWGKGPPNLQPPTTTSPPTHSPTQPQTNGQTDRQADRQKV